MVAHKVRLLLTTASIALGVAFLAGTFILTDTMGLAFTQLFGKIGSGTDTVVRTQSAYDQASGVGLSRAPIAASVLDQVEAVDGVRAAEGSVTGYALLTDNHGKAVLTSGGAPTQGYSLPRDVTLRGDVQVSSGHAPRGPHQVVIDTTSPSARTSTSCSADPPDASRLSAPSSSAARRTSAARRRRTSTRRPPSRCSARPTPST